MKTGIKTAMITGLFVAAATLGQAKDTGISFEQYQTAMKQRDEEVALAVKQARFGEKIPLLKELHDIRTNLHSAEESYEAYATKLQQHTDALEKAGEQAEAAFQQGKMAELNVRYLDAIGDYQKALNLSADNAQYTAALKTVKDQLAAYDKLLKEPSNKNDGSKGADWLKKGDYDQAIGFYEKELENALNTYGDIPPEAPNCWNNLGDAWLAKGDYDKAIESYRSALLIGLKYVGDDHVAVVNSWTHLGDAYKAKGIYKKSIRYYENALASVLRNHDEKHPDIPRHWNNLLKAWKVQSHNKSTAWLMPNMMDSFDHAIHADPPNTMQILNKLDAYLKNQEKAKKRRKKK